MFRILFFYFFVSNVFGLEISHKDRVLSILDDLNAESFPVVLGLKSVVEDLPEAKLTTIIRLLNELITNATTQNNTLWSRVTKALNYKNSNQTDVNEKTTVWSNAEDLRKAASVTTTAATRKAEKETAESLLSTAKTQYNDALSYFQSENLTKTITSLIHVRNIILDIFRDQSLSPTTPSPTAPTRAPTRAPTTAPTSSPTSSPAGGDIERNTICGGVAWISYIKNDGTVWVVGSFSIDISSDPDVQDVQRVHLTPVQIGGLPAGSKVVEIMCNGYSIDMLLDSGDLWHVGRNDEQYMGPCGAHPKKVCKNANLNNVASLLGMNWWGSLFVSKSDLTVWASGRIWGLPSFGTGTKQEIDGVDMSKVKQVACDAEYCCYLLAENGDTYFMGLNERGQRGDGTKGKVETWTKTEMSDVQWISGNIDGFHFLKTNGDLWAVGQNRQNQLGLGKVGETLTYTQVNIPSLYPDGLKPILKIWSVGTQCWFIHTDNTMSYSGNMNGLGSQGVNNDGLIVPHTSLNDWLAAEGRKIYDIGSEWYGTAWVMLDNDDVISFGANNYGSLGLGDSYPAKTPLSWGMSGCPGQLGNMHIQKARFESNQPVE